MLKYKMIQREEEEKEEEEAGVAEACVNVCSVHNTLITYYLPALYLFRGSLRRLPLKTESSGSKRSLACHMGDNLQTLLKKSHSTPAKLYFRLQSGSCRLEMVTVRDS